jgi:hypothetical protein
MDTESVGRRTKYTATQRTMACVKHCGLERLRDLPGYHVVLVDFQCLGVERIARVFDVFVTLVVIKELKNPSSAINDTEGC